MIDPLPSKYNYPKNNNTNLFYDFKDDYEFYEKLIIGYTFFITANYISYFLISKYKFVYTILTNIIFFIIYSKILKYKYVLKKQRCDLYIPKLITYGLQKYINTPHIFKGNNKEIMFPKYKIFENNHTIILKETNNIIQNIKNIPLFSNVIPYNGLKISDFDKKTNRAWRAVPLKIEGVFTSYGKQYLPNTCKIINIPEIRNCFISVLEGKRHIGIHKGYFKGYIRYLYCIIEPKEGYSFIYINKEKYIFKEGQGILWDDTYPHEVYNMSDDVRICLFVDVVRKFDNKIFNAIFNKIFLISKYSKQLKERTKVYEPKPTDIDDFPKL